MTQINTHHCWPHTRSPFLNLPVPKSKNVLTMFHSFLLFLLSVAKLVICTAIVSALKHFKIHVCGIFTFMKVNKPPVLQKVGWLWLVRLVGWLPRFLHVWICRVKALAELLRSSSESSELCCIFDMFAFLIKSKCTHKNANQSWKLCATLFPLIEVLKFCLVTLPVLSLSQIKIWI